MKNRSHLVSLSASCMPSSPNVWEGTALPTRHHPLLTIFSSFIPSLIFIFISLLSTTTKSVQQITTTTSGSANQPCVYSLLEYFVQGKITISRESTYCFTFKLNINFPCFLINFYVPFFSLFLLIFFPYMIGSRVKSTCTFVFFSSSLSLSLFKIISNIFYSLSSLVYFAIS